MIRKLAEERTYHVHWVDGAEATDVELDVYPRRLSCNQSGPIKFIKLKSSWPIIGGKRDDSTAHTSVSSWRLAAVVHAGVQEEVQLPEVGTRVAARSVGDPALVTMLALRTLRLQCSLTILNSHHFEI